jgi:dipeptidase E
METLFLSSDGKFVIEEGIKLVFGDTKKVKLAYITTAAKKARNKEFFELDKDLLKNSDLDYKEFDIAEKSQNEIREFLKDKNAVYIEGGNPFYLLKMVRESGFGKIIEELINKGVAYFGVSAGSYIACPTIEVADWKKPGEEKERFGVTDLTALNLVPFLIKAHYKPAQKEFLREKIASARYPVKVLEDGQALFIQGEEVKLVGEGEEIII